MQQISLDSPSFLERLQARLRAFSPTFLTIIVLLFSIAPTYIPGYSSVRPSLTMVPIYYFAIYMPHSFSVINAFLMGLALDLLENTPLGVNTLVFTVFYLAIASQRRFLKNKSFLSTWIGFAVICFGAYLLKWLVVSINLAKFMPLTTTFTSYVLLVMCYPLMAYPCAKLHLYLLDKEI